MSVSVALCARNVNTLRYLINQNGEDSFTSANYTFDQMRVDLAFNGSPLDILLETAAETLDLELMEQRILGSGSGSSTTGVVEPSTPHAVTSIVRQFWTTAVVNHLSVTVQVNLPTISNLMFFETSGNSAMSWIVQIQIEHTYIQ